MTPAVALDHVLLAVPDLERAAARLTREQGLAVLPGGRHPGAGTANMIVPLGAAYLELIAIVDPVEAAANPLSGRVGSALARRAAIATWAVRTADLDALRSRLDADGIATTGPRRGSRLRPDGVLLEWRTLHVGDGLEPVIPFFIEWRVGPGRHPGEQPVRHPAGAARLKTLRLASPDPRALERRLRDLLGALPLVEVVEGPREEPSAVVLEVAGEDRTLTTL
jgi:hypothetical protein